MGSEISPLAVIVLYHCYNGGRSRFLQQLADLVDRPVFGYTGFLVWFHNEVRPITIPLINSDWEEVRTRRLITQEFDYLPDMITDEKGEWVAATPSIKKKPEK